MSKLSDQARELASKATPGQWRVNDVLNSVESIDSKGLHKICDMRGWGHLTGRGSCALGLSDDEAIQIQQNDAELIAFLRNNIDALCDEIDELNEAAKGSAAIANSAGQTIKEQQDEIKRLEKERDRAIADIPHDCFFCAHMKLLATKEPCRSCKIGYTKADNWTYRGVEEDGK